MTDNHFMAKAAPPQDMAKEMTASEAQFHAIAEAMPQLVFLTTADGDVDFFNISWYAFTGFSKGSANRDGWKTALHPDDIDRVAAIRDKARRTSEPCEDEYLLKHHSGGYRWVLTRAQPGKLPDRTILWWLGTSTDINALKTADKQRSPMLHEMTHRIKNTLTLVQVIASQTLRHSPTLQEADRALQKRISTLAIAHDQLVRSAWTSANITDVVLAALAPHREGTGRFDIRGPALAIGFSQAVALTMALHKLATNATKYGALSTQTGQVHLHLQVDPAERVFRISWKELDGPAVAPPTHGGFGSRMVKQAVAGYFGGTSTLTFASDSLFFEMSAPLAQLDT